MGGQGFDPEKRWIPVGNGLKEFFADPYSKTVRASLQFFPQNDVTIEAACTYPYHEPAVPLSIAADPAFVNAIDTTKPSGGTPTLPALEGGIAYAKKVAAERPDDKTAVVLVTDGEPGFYDPDLKKIVPGCENNDVANSAKAAKAALESDTPIATYVIGVGPQLEALNQIAVAGGTSSAVMVDANDPAATKASIVAALDAIRRREVSCDFSIPPPPAGQELDPFAVNVVLQGEGGAEKILSYSKDCNSNEGWRYDDAAAPTKILLCSSACEDARASSLGKVSIAFGCKTRIDVR
jgi:hypothetical protein